MFACVGIRDYFADRSTCIEINVDPRRPRSLPELRLLGPADDVAELNEAMNRNLEIWSAVHEDIRNCCCT